MGLATQAGMPTPYTFVWDWVADLGMGGSPTAYLQVTPSDAGGSGAACQDGPFSVP
jgi:hypothetical protein